MYTKSVLFWQSLFANICFLNSAQRFWKHPTYPWLFVSSVIMLLVVIRWVDLGNRLVLRDHPWSIMIIPSQWLEPPLTRPKKCLDVGLPWAEICILLIYIYIKYWLLIGIYLLDHGTNVVVALLWILQRWKPGETAYSESQRLKEGNICSFTLNTTSTKNLQASLSQTIPNTCPGSIRIKSSHCQCNGYM